MRVAAVVCAAGEAKRFGGEVKCLLPFGKGTLLNLLVKNLRACEFSEIVLVCGHEGRRVAEAARGFSEVRCVENPRFSEGLGASVAFGVRSLGAETEGIALFLADKPFVRSETVRILLEVFRGEGGTKVVYPSFGGVQGHPVVFPIRLRQRLEALTGPSGAKTLLVDAPEATRAVETDDEGVVEDVDTPEDYAMLRKKYEG